ncbi:MAG: LysR family transcriptional regulator, partial [Rhodospirillaceae bacterium]|nr:LysR family transcriptional regulator [Rhodospirillaceae bacterium]
MDLNLYAVFAAIMRHGSVSQAGLSLGLTQPATSNALTRLRGQLGDQLFVRSKNGMLPTKFATQMAPIIERALADLQNVAREGATSGTDLADLKRNFTFVMSDLEEALFLTDLIGGLATAAPGVSVEVKPFRSDILQDELEL